MTREEWLRHAVEELDAVVFGGSLDLTGHQFQIGCGRTPGKKLTETIQPYGGEDVTMDDFFPTTIGVDFTTKDVITMLTTLCWECIHAFFNIDGNTKRFKSLAKEYHFEKPFRADCATDDLLQLIRQVSKNLTTKYGEFPGKPIVFHPKPKKEGKKSVIELFCPECGYALKIGRKVFEMYNKALPTCICGAKMAADDEIDTTDESKA